MLPRVAEAQRENDEARRAGPPLGADPEAADLGRVLALSDGVFAIAITLLAIELRLPPGLTIPGAEHALHELLPQIGAYLLSYGVIGVLWLGHHRQFRALRRVDFVTARINLLMLGLVAALPFPSGLIAEYGDSKLFIVLYDGFIAAIFLLQVTMLVRARRRGDLDTRNLRDQGLPLRLTLTATVFVIAALVALLTTTGRGQLCLLLVLPLGLALRVRNARRTRAATRTS
jgi:uncharacterized membrane protein